MRMWAFWRRVQYLTGTFLFFLLVFTGVYFLFFYEPAHCFDGAQNGEERGIDCGGSCALICAFDVLKPEVLWARAFKVTEGQYNAVAYIENKNVNAGTPELNYTFKLFDATGLIAERSGTSILPPDSVYPIFEGRIATGDRTPTRIEIETNDITLWLNAESGREQFVIEERQLSSSDVRPRLDAKIANTALTEAEDVEIVATIFDINGNPLTASRTVVPRIAARTTEDIVFTWPEPISTTVRSCEVPTDIVLAIDLSGSMNDDGGDPLEPISSVLAAAKSFVSRLKDNDTIGLVTYATEAALRETLTTDTLRVANMVGELTIAKVDETGSTNTGDALKLSTAEINSERHNPDARKVVVLLTDGLANAPGEDPETYAIEAAAMLKESGTEVFTIGLGDKVNETFLRSIATDEAHYFKAPTAGTLGRIYETITAAICEDGAAIIEIIPKAETSFKPIR